MPSWLPRARGPRRSSGRAWWRLPAGQTWRRRRGAPRARRWRCFGHRGVTAAGQLLQGACREGGVHAGRLATMLGSVLVPASVHMCRQLLTSLVEQCFQRISPQRAPYSPEASLTELAAAMSADSVRREQGAFTAGGPPRPTWRRQYLRNTSLASCTCIDMAV